MENIIQQVDGLLSKLTFIPSVALQLAFVGVILLLIIFIVAVLISCGSRIKGLTKKILKVNTVFTKMEQVDEENVYSVNAELVKLPEAVADGWGRFLEQRIGYPSDYMKEKSVLDENTYSNKTTAGKYVFKIFGFLVLSLIAIFTVFLCATDASNVGLKDFFDNFNVVGGLVGSIFFPILYYIIFDIIISEIYKKQRYRLQLVYKTFQDTLDLKVVIYANEEEEFVSDNLEEITKNIEGIIAQRMDDKEMVDVITTPSIYELEKNFEDEKDETEEVEIKEEVAAEPEKVTEEIIVPEEKVEESSEDMETMADEVVAVVPLTAEEQERYLEVLTVIVENAINDPETKREDLEEIAVLIYNNVDSFENEQDRKILDDCLQRLADLFYSQDNK
jgi:hypothetical protein